MTTRMLPYRQLATLLAVAFFSPIVNSAPEPPPLSSPDATPEAHLGPEFHGEVRGVASVSAAGNASYSIPLELPPGTNGMRPGISFEYNSNMKNGLLGVGWFLQGASSSIARCSQTLAQDGRIRAVRLDDQDRFCLDGQRLVAVNGGTYGADGTEYRTEIDSFRRIVSHGQVAGEGGGPLYFTVESATGITSYFGQGDDARVEVQNGNVAYAWALNRSEDVHGNYYLVEYSGRENLGAPRVRRILYTGNDEQGVLPYAEVRFEYERRPDRHTLYRAGVPLREHRKRLRAVRTYVDSQLVTEYDITYEEFGIDDWEEPSGNQSRIVAIGRCDGQGVCQLPLSLQWWPDHSSLEFATEQLVVPSDSGSYWQHWEYPRWHELNGDGIPDYVYTVQSGSRPNEQEVSGTFEVLLSDPAAPGGWSADTWYTPEIAPHRNFDAIAWGDVDGDGLTDMITPVPGVERDRDIAIAFSSGAGFEVALWDGYDTAGDATQLHYLDMNGDYRLDLVVVRERLARQLYGDCKGEQVVGFDREYSVEVALNTGENFGPPATWSSGLHSNVDLADMDGDGLTDLVSETRYVHINDGAGFEPPSDFGSHGAQDCANPFTYAALFVDFNGDGLADRLVEGEIELNTGAAFVNKGEAALIPLADINGDGRNDGFTWYTYPTASDPKTASVTLGFNKDGYGGSARYRELPHVDDLNHFHQLADINGDGLYDFTGVANYPCLAPWPHPGGTWEWCESDRMRIYLNKSPPAYLLHRIVTGLGHTTAFSYRPLTDSTVYRRYADAELPLVDVQDATHVVAAMEVPDGVGGLRTTRYRYEGLKRDYSGRGLLGFARVEVLDEVADSTEVTYYSQQFPHHANPLMVETYQTSTGVLLTRQQTRYEVTGGAIPHAYVATSVGERFDLGDGALLATTEVRNSVDEFGNIVDKVTELTDHIEGETRTHQVLSTYLNEEPLWRIRQLVEVRERHSLNGVHEAGLDKHRTIAYRPDNGMPWRFTRAPGAGEGLELVRELHYDGFGNPASETVSGPGLLSRTSTTDYGPRGQFPGTITNALGHLTRQHWQADLGVLAVATDANGLTTQRDFDGFGALVRVLYPDGRIERTGRYVADGGVHSLAATYRDTQVTGGSPRREFFDLLGRPLGIRTRGLDGRVINLEQAYDERGRVSRVSAPYFSGASVQFSTSTFDHLDRPLSLAAADPAESYMKFYQRNKVTTVDLKINATQQWFSPLGQVIRVRDAAGSETRFEYDAAGNRVAVNNPDGRGGRSTVNYYYDHLGRVTGFGDPNRGHHYYLYDALGNKIREVSPGMAASGQHRTFEYDLLGRLVRRTEPEGTSTWQFDDTTHGNLGIGRLHAQSIGAMQHTYRYAPEGFGRASAVHSTLDGKTYTHEYNYNAQGKLARQTYPSGFTVEHTYNALGYLERLQSPGGAVVYYQVTGVDASGRLTGEWKGDGSLTAINYEGVSARVVDQEVVGAAGTVQHFGYSYDALGSLVERRDVLHSLSESFGYDAMDRLATSHVAGGQQRQYTFDATGNVRRKDGTAHAYEYDHPEAVHAVTGLVQGNATRNIAYDLDGNMIGGDEQPSMDWSSYGKPTRIANAAHAYSFEYGPDRSRYKKTQDGVITHYLNGNYEKLFAGYLWADRHYLMVGGRPVMMRVTFLGAEQHTYLHYDHLGSVTAMTLEADGEVTQRLSYDAWGGRRAASDWIAAAPGGQFLRGFTGHEHLDEFGMVHMNGRVYSARLGRMLSPDPVTQAPEYSQNYNRYSYVYNNPLKYTDPSGYACYRSSAGPGGPYRYGMCFSMFFNGFSVRPKIAERGPSRYSPINRSVAATYTRSFRSIRRGVRQRVGDRYDEVGNPYSDNIPTGLLTTGSMMQLLDNFMGDESDVVDFIANDIMNGREPGIIYLTGHDLLGTNQGHLALEFTSTGEAAPETLSGGPGGPFGQSLVNTPGRESDMPGNNYTVGVVTPPPGVSAQEHWQSLVNADVNYGDQCCVGYDAVPGLLPGRPEYNSNGYIFGLLNSAGGTTRASVYKFTGANNPVPKRFYRR